MYVCMYGAKERKRGELIVASLKGIGWLYYYHYYTIQDHIIISCFFKFHGKDMILVVLG